MSPSPDPKQRSQDLTTAADDLGRVAAVLAKNEPYRAPDVGQRGYSVSGL